MVVDLHVIGDQIRAVLDRDARIFLVLLELGQLRLRCNPDHATITTLVQALGTQHDVQCLVPRHIDQTQGHIALHRVRGDHVEIGLLGNQLQHGAHRHVLEVEGHRTPAVTTRRHGSSSLGDGLGGHRTGSHVGLARSDLDHILIAGLVGQRVECAVGAEHQLRTLPRRLGVDTLHRCSEINHIERPLQFSRQHGIANVDHDVVALVAQVRACTLTIELHDQPSRTVIATLEVDLGNGNRLHCLLGGCGSAADTRNRLCCEGRAAHRCQRHSQGADADQCMAPDGTQAQGFGKSHRAIP